MMLGLFFDIENNVILNPVLQDPIGFGRSSSNFIKLEKGWTLAELAEAIMEGLSISQKNNLEEAKGEKFWTRATGIKGYAAFSKRYRHILIECVEEKDYYIVSAYKRCKDGSYGIDADEVEAREKNYSGFPSIETIAEQVMEALQRV